MKRQKLEKEGDAAAPNCSDKPQKKNRSGCVAAAAAEEISANASVGGASALRESRGNDSEGFLAGG